VTVASYVTPTTDELRAKMPDDEDVRGIGEMPTALERTVDDLIDHLDERDEHDAVVTLGRDWEGMPFGIVSGVNGPWDVLAFTDTGRIGLGGINLPRYYDSVAELVDALR
jgi:hypothetical protein